MRSLAAIAMACVALAAACASPPTPTPTPTPPVVEAILATTDLRVGEQRLAFLLVTDQDIVREPTASVAWAPVDDTAAARTATADFREWPLGSRGAYATEVDFDRPGAWRLDLTVGTGSASVVVDVAAESAIVDVGSLPPFAANKTLANVDRIEQLTSDPTPDPELYTQTIPQALIAGRPAVVVFATPALCTSPTCGPQVDTISQLRERRAAQAAFIHVEVYDNPADIQGDLANAVYSPLVDAWGFTTAPNWFNESWTYVLGADGRVAARFEGFATVEELDAALAAAL